MMNIKNLFRFYIEYNSKCKEEYKERILKQIKDGYWIDPECGYGCGYGYGSREGDGYGCGNGCGDGEYYGKNYNKFLDKYMLNEDWRFASILCWI